MATTGADADTADDLHSLLDLQRVELTAADSLESDLDFAFRLQLHEAISASLAHHPSPSTSSSRPLSTPPPPPSQEQYDAVSPTFASLQTEELLRLDRELSDCKQAKLEMQKAREDLHRTIHDHNFAKELAGIADDEWEESGDNFEKPLCADGGDDDYLFKVYSKGMLTEELINGEKVSLAGIGVAICDQTDDLIFELKKPLIESGLNKNATETKALIEALNAAVSLEITRVRFISDCFPLCQFIAGKWPVKQRKVAVLVDQVFLLQKKFNYFNLQHVARNDMKYVFEFARAAINSQIAVPAEPSLGKTINETCGICLEDTDVRHIFSIDGCLHRYCYSCMKKHVEEKLGQGMEPTCPHEGCKTKLIVESCRKFLTLKLFEKWNQHIKEAMIPVTEKVYCPYPKCSALMSKSEIEHDASSSSFVGRRIGARKCTKCHRRFCMKCKVPWHNNMTCGHYKRLNPNPPTEDVKLKSLASSNRWRQCVKCNHMIELAEGCFHMTCRCGHEFCYNCGAEWKNKKATCSCPLWDEDNILDSDSDSDSYEDDEDEEDEDQDEDEFEYADFH